MQKLDTSYLAKINNALQKKNIINLGVGQPDFKPPKHILNAFRKSISEYTGYTPIDGLPELKKLIIKKLRRENNIKAEDVVVTSGAVEAVFDSILGHLKHDNEIILFLPYYGKYATIPNIIGADVKTVALKNNRPNIAELEKKITKKTKMIVLNSPGNPTGIVFSKDEIKQLTEIVDKNDLILLSDEVYEKFVYDGKKHISAGSFSDRVITINSFSKTYGFPGLRLGYLAGSAELVEPARFIHTSNTTCCPYSSQKAAISALKGKCPVDLKLFDKRRKLIIKHLNNIGADYIYPEGAFYVYIYTKKDSKVLSNKLIDKGILTMPNHLFGDDKNAIRISYAVEFKKLEKALNILDLLI